MVHVISPKFATLCRLLGAVVSLGSSAVLPSSAAIRDRPALSVEGVVVVWAADDYSNAPVASDFIIENNGANADLIAGDVVSVLTGTLEALDEDYAGDAGATLRITNIVGAPNQETTANGDRVTNSDDVFSAFRLRANTDVRTIRSEIESSFYVASNTAFSIDAVASTSGPAANLNLIQVRMRVSRSGADGGLGFGGAAQFPHTGNSPTSGVRFTGFRRLSLMTAGTNFYNSNRRTAATAGTIADQSVRFDQVYRWNTGNIDLSEGVFDVEAEVVYTVYTP